MFDLLFIRPNNQQVKNRKNHKVTMKGATKSNGKKNFIGKNVAIREKNLIIECSNFLILFLFCCCLCEN